MLWVTIVGIIVLPLIGWAINTLITRKIDDQNTRIEDLEKVIEDNKKSFYATINGQRGAFENTLKEYVRKEMYDQAHAFLTINTDEKFKSVLSIVTTQYTNLETKINDSNRITADKINDLKNLINDKFNGHKP